MKIVLLLALTSASALAATVDYKSLKDSKGNGVPDFSFAGYHASSAKLPSLSSSPKASLKASSGDQTSRIQGALDTLGKNGGGVLALAAGNFTVKPGLTIPNGTVLRGAGVGKTNFLVSSASGHIITLGATASSPKISEVADIMDSYVPVGSNSFTVSTTTGLKVGQDVMVQREATQEWINANGMGNLGEGDEWIRPGQILQQPRKIAAIDGKKVTVDVPLTDQLDKKYMSAKLATYTYPADASSEMGVENIGIVLSPSCSGVDLQEKSCLSAAIYFVAYSQDSWARNLQIQGYNSGISVAKGSRRHTIDNVNFIRDQATDHRDGHYHGYASDIDVGGCQILISNSAVRTTVAKARSYVVTTGSLVPGPNVVTNFYTQEADSSIQPHQKWATGFLVDNSTSSAEFINRGNAGSGHGWAINTGVAWNVKAASDGDVRVDSPPLGTNWGVGISGGKILGNSTQIISKGSPVQPVSLFQAQLQARGH